MSALEGERAGVGYAGLYELQLEFLSLTRLLKTRGVGAGGAGCLQIQKVEGLDFPMLGGLLSRAARGVRGSRLAG